MAAARSLVARAFFLVEAWGGSSPPTLRAVGDNFRAARASIPVTVSGRFDRKRGTILIASDARFFLRLEGSRPALAVA